MLTQSLTEWLDDKSDSLVVLIKGSDGANYTLSEEETLFGVAYSLTVTIPGSSLETKVMV